MNSSLKQRVTSRFSVIETRVTLLTWMVGGLYAILLGTLPGLGWLVIEMAIKLGVFGP